MRPILNRLTLNNTEAKAVDRVLSDDASDRKKDGDIVEMPNKAFP